MDSETTQQLIDAQNLTTNAMHRHHTEQQTQRDIAEIKSMLKELLARTGKQVKQSESK